MKKFILLFLLLNIYFLQGQQNGKVIYKIAFDEKAFDKELENVEDPVLRNMIYNNKAKKLKRYEWAKEIPFILKFNPNESIYYMEDILVPDNLSNRDLLRIKVNGRVLNKIYVNKKDSIIMFQYTALELGKLVRETKHFKDVKWKITPERDTILGYPVIKATKGRAMAWFTPDIPVPFGPGDDVGLPGLILKYQYNSNSIVAEKIIFSKKPIKIKIPTKGLLRTKKEGEEARIKAFHKLER